MGRWMATGLAVTLGIAFGDGACGGVASMVDAGAGSDGGGSSGADATTSGSSSSSGASSGGGASSGASSGGSTSSGGGSGSSSGAIGDAGTIACGAAFCPAVDRCCDHCTGRCVNAASGQNCPDDNNPTHACGDAGCNAAGSSCLGTPCCAGLTCCSGVPIPPGQATCEANCPQSDRNAKAGFTPVEPEAVLQALTTMPVSRWHYKSDSPEIQHIGPMAQDFKALFDVGADDKHIFQIDADGVSFAAIQALAHKLDALAASQQTLERENADLRTQVRSLEAQVAGASSSCEAR
ncbi:MAG: tail fiber domain-containing protein [Myxococcales bacterium]|nr:tail fiber domain-containing protein [Myxococcales bacterium]